MSFYQVILLAPLALASAADSMDLATLVNMANKVIEVVYGMEDSTEDGGRKGIV